METAGFADRSEARSAITETIHEYAWLAKEQADFPSMVPLWVQGGTFTLPNGVAVGPAEISSIVSSGEPNFIRHHVTTVRIEFVDDNTARTDTYFIAFTDIAQPDHWGRWEDTLLRQDDGRWLFSNKSVVIEGYSTPSFWADLIRKLES